MRLAAILLLLPFAAHAQQEKEKQVLAGLLSACENLKSASFVLGTYERRKDGHVEEGEMYVKLEHSPVKLYAHLYRPSAGAELLYCKGKWNDLLFISPNGFPFMNLKLDPNNMSVRKNSHHTVCDIGFDYLMNMIGHYRQVFGNRLYDYLTLGDTVQFERHRCLKMEFDYPDFGYIPYVVRPGENVIRIAAANFVHEYMIVCANPDVSNVHDVRAGQRIRIPNMFARKIIFYVDLKTMLPLVQEIYDEKGFFEKYEYRSFVINPVFNPAEFTPEYKDYGF